MTVKRFARFFLYILKKNTIDNVILVDIISLQAESTCSLKKEVFVCRYYCRIYSNFRRKNEK